MQDSRPMTQGMLELLAERFKVLGEPARLQLIFTLREGVRTVTELVRDTGLGQANTSRHLQILHAQGFVTRRKLGLRVEYSLTDRTILGMCETMFDRMQSDIVSRQQQLGR